MKHVRKLLLPGLNSFITLLPEEALTAARRAESDIGSGKSRGPLHGIPWGAKDLLATRGIPTSWGAAPMKDRVIATDATVIIRLREAGAVLAAKLAMVELAGGMGYKQSNASFTGAGLNPWDTGRWSGGSSSGPGSAGGAGLVPFASGSETWGSIMNPAGLIGMFMGVMLAFVFCAMTMNAVGRAAYAMMQECRRQFEIMKKGFKAKLHEDLAA